MKFLSFSLLCLAVLTESNVVSEEVVRELQECTVDTEISGVCSYDAVAKAVNATGCTETELFSMLGTANEAEARTIVSDMCEKADKDSKENFVDWHTVTDRGYQFDKEFFHGGTIFNEEYATADKPDLLATQTARLKQIETNIVKKRGISWPNTAFMKSFGVVHGGNCNEPVIMCCWTADRDKVGAGSCSGVDCQDENPVNNTNVCRFDSRDAAYAAHVPDGTTIFPGGAEGAVNCHGFVGKTALDNKYAGNSLFNLAMSYGLMGNGYAREVQGAPMCGCVDSMPKVTHAGCSSTEVTEKFSVQKKFGKLEIKQSGVDISFGDCGGKTLNAEFEAKYGRKVINNLLDDCSNGEARYLATKGYKKSTAKWVPIIGHAAMYYRSDPSKFREIWAQSPNQIMRRVCPDCKASHQDIYYRRFDENGLPANFDLVDLLVENWRLGTNNEHKKDFKLYSTYEDAVKDQNAWEFCSARDTGFPHDCGPTGPFGHQWNAIKKSGYIPSHTKKGFKFYAEGA